MKKSGKCVRLSNDVMKNSDEATIKSEVALSSYCYGPICATMYLTDNNEIRLQAWFYDEDVDKTYPGPDEIIAQVPPQLVTIKEEMPARFLTSKAWRTYIESLWDNVQNKPFFYWE